MFTDYNEFFMMDGEAAAPASVALPYIHAAADITRQHLTQQQSKAEPEVAFATTDFSYGAQVPSQGHWDSTALSFEAIGDTSHVTVSPAELMSAASTASSCFSELDQSPLIEDLDLCDETSWTSLFEDQAPTVATTTSPSTTAMPTPIFTANSNAVASLAKPEPAQIPLVDTLHKRPLSHPSPSSTLRRSEAPQENLRKGPMTFAEALAEEVNKKLKRDLDRFAVGPTGNKIDEHGVTVYKRKPRSAPLRPIAFPDGDTVASKRARNTESARKSRARKMERMVQLEDLVSELTQEKQALESEVVRLKKLCGEA